MLPSVAAVGHEPRSGCRFCADLALWWPRRTPVRRPGPTSDCRSDLAIDVLRGGRPRSCTDDLGGLIHHSDQDVPTPVRVLLGPAVRERHRRLGRIEGRLADNVATETGRVQSERPPGFAGRSGSRPPRGPARPVRVHGGVLQPPTTPDRATAITTPTEFAATINGRSTRSTTVLSDQSGSSSRTFGSAGATGRCWWRRRLRAPPGCERVSGRGRWCR